MLVAEKPVLFLLCPGRKQPHVLLGVPSPLQRAMLEKEDGLEELRALWSPRAARSTPSTLRSPIKRRMTT
jgi:hypothetical protein